MSGFFGIVRTDGAPVDPALLERVSRNLEFRGPDGNHVWVKENFGACSTFLETGTLHQTRNLPLSIDGRYWVIGEIRLDGRRELAAELREKGEQATEETPDAELVLRSWRAWGRASFGKILGDFSFGLWDAACGFLYCARDFAGARPFYYARGQGVFCFSNTLSLLPGIPGIADEIDERFVYDFLLNGPTEDPELTVWRSVRRLPPAHRIYVANGKLEVRRFLHLPIEEPLNLKQPQEYVDAFREIFERAVADRLPQGKSSFYLSGGLDSSSVCAMAKCAAPQRVLSGEFKAFTVSWRPLFDDPEPECARNTANYLGLDHEIVQDDRSLPDEEAAAPPSPEPTAELFLESALQFYRVVAEHSRVVLSGDGGDNVLTGRAWPFLKYLWARGDWSGILRKLSTYVLQTGRMPHLGGGFRTRLRVWTHPSETQNTVPAWLNEDFARRMQMDLQNSAGPKESLPAHPVHPFAYQGLHSGFWGGVLEEEDAGWTRVNLETRAPFLDLRLLRFLLRLPPVPWCMHKELTRRAMIGRLPVDILKRRKTPLLQDPLEVCQRTRRWRPTSNKNPAKAISKFVKWDSWTATLENSKGLVSREILYPLFLSRWLKVVENAMGIQ
jgi:asparagine synthase (glutamine-hydrolysing)